MKLRARSYHAAKETRHKARGPVARAIDPTVVSEQERGALLPHPNADEDVLATCWCDHRLVTVPLALVRLGLTYPCGDGCALVGARLVARAINNYREEHDR